MLGKNDENRYLVMTRSRCFLIGNENTLFSSMPTLSLCKMLAPASILLSKHSSDV